MSTQKQNVKTMLKCKFSNEIHSIFQPDDSQKNTFWRKYHIRVEKYKNFSDKQKAEMFDKLFSLYNDHSISLHEYSESKKEKKIVNKKRIERGWKPKHKTTKEEWAMMQQNLKTI